tara:strand:+ start:28122 stop:29246 length:1125 start_codon:yes stop_codon:yes gene_type:complete
MTVFGPSLARLALADASDFLELQVARAAWAEIFAEDSRQYEALYERIVSAGQTMLDQASSEAVASSFSPFSPGTAEVFLCAVADTGYLRAIGSKVEIEGALAKHNTAILSLIRNMIDVAEERQDLAQTADALISLYFHHTHFGATADMLHADVARLIPDALIAFPDHSFSFALFLLARSVDAARQIGRVLAFHVVTRGDTTNAACSEIAKGTLGLRSRPNETLCTLGPAIMGALATAVRDNRPEMRDGLVAAFVLMPLDCNPRGREEEIARYENDLLSLRSRLSSFEKQLKSPMPVTAQDTPLVLDIARAEETLEEVTADFQKWMHERRDLAVRQISAQPVKCATLKAMQSALAPLKSVELDRLLAEAEAARST